MLTLKLRKTTYIVKRDPHCFVIIKMSTVKDKESPNFGQPIELIQGYYHSIRAVIISLVNLACVDHLEGKELKTMVNNAINELTKQVQENIIFHKENKKATKCE